MGGDGDWHAFFERPTSPKVCTRSDFSIFHLHFMIEFSSVYFSTPTT